MMEKENINNTIEEDLNRRNRNWDKISALISDVDGLINYVGDLETLTTDEKSTIVGALNEIDSSIKSHLVENVNQGNPHGIDAKANKQQENWIKPTLLNDWTEIYPVEYRKNEFGNVEIKGLVGEGITNDNTTIFQLPEGYRPSSNRRFVSVGYSENDIQLVILNISTAGNVQIFRSSGNFTYLSIESTITL